MRALRVPRSLVLTVAAAIVVFPAALSLADWYRLDGQGRVIHHHTASYGLYNAVGSGDTALRDRINWARADWHNGTSKIGVPAFDVWSGSKIWTRRSNEGQNNAAVIWSSPWHATPPTEVISTATTPTAGRTPRSGGGPAGSSGRSSA